MAVVGVKVELRNASRCVGCSGCVGATVSAVGADESNWAEHSYSRSKSVDNGCCNTHIWCRVKHWNQLHGTRWYNSGCLLWVCTASITALFAVAVEIFVYVPLRVRISGRTKEVCEVRTVLIFQFNTIYTSYDDIGNIKHVMQCLHNALRQTQHTPLTESCSRCRGRDQGRRS